MPRSWSREGRTGAADHVSGLHDGRGVPDQERSVSLEIPKHLIDRGVQAIIRRREAESGCRLAVVARPDHPEPVGATSSSNVDRSNHREGKGT